MPLKFIVSTKKQKQLLHEGFLYNKKAVNKSSITWRCIEYHTLFYCPAIIHTDMDNRNGNIIGNLPDHSHLADASSVGAKVVINKIKKRAANCDDNPGAVIGSALASVSSPIVAKLPKIASLTRDVQRARKTNVDQLENSNSRRDLVIPEQFTMTDKGDQLLLYDSGGNRSRFLIFATEQNLNTLADCQEWAGDGTFSSVPSIFMQLYTVHGLVNGKLLPLVYILMPNKHEDTYSNVLSVLKDRLPAVNLKRMMVDFESAFINAFRLCFPDADVTGCFFHFTQCVWRHVQSLGLQKKYNTDVRFALNVRMMMAIAFVPKGDVHAVFDKLIRSRYYDENEIILEPLISYFERTWIGVPSRSGKRRLKPYFSCALWNCHDAVVQERMRTNNALEGWHNSFNGKVRVHHASLSKFISVIKCEQSMTETYLVQLNTGLPIATKRKKVYADIDSRLKNIVSRYDPAKQLQYIHDIAAVLSM